MGASNAGAGSSDDPNTARSVVTKVKSQTPIRDFFKSGGVTGAIVRGVSGAIQKSKTDKALQGTSDYQGSKSKSNVGFTNNNGGGNDNNNQPVIIKKNIGGNTIQTTAPTEAEVSQSETANADASALKVKKKGRSMTMLTGSKGVRGMASNYSLGKKSLLGQV
mgnify:CR=1 FL=1|jgi:hypothetical protein